MDDQYISFNMSFCSMYIYIYICTHLPCCMIYLFRKNKQVFKLKNDCFLQQTTTFGLPLSCCCDGAISILGFQVKLERRLLVDL